ncbi:SDR family NAD(P)-dependent oxidoreductase [Enterobacillus tribolii]|uniref:3-oxoacyl-[acyl-carrier protein] reductase n=1 Tax=Enterobacillus tribolii TaxID=1487935 RepID=A0A370R0U4_9GAMM|nr:SDR family oxidoreductase [Enterobacillus tribolii]MBW7982900.1 SDR family oxidoreductase [Enterobacillus tribolii]RDK95539.1 3-oxoacyl-[acyl-carrier protein] reductase [Enterobacillus tribolii]
MLSEIQGKRVLITGSSAGIGLAIAKLFLRYGAQVGINGRSTITAPQVLDELNALPGRFTQFSGDLSRSENCENVVSDFVQHFGGMDVLINNAGGLGGRSGLEGIDDEFYERVMDLNVRSVLMTTKYAIPHLRASARESGLSSAVISTGSIAGRDGGGIGAGVYGSAKAWVHNMHRNWVKEFTKDNIRFNIVSPGSIDTRFHADKRDDVLQNMRNSIPMGRFGLSEEVAPAYLFLATHAFSGYITGQIIDVNGGQLAP